MKAILHCGRRRDHKNFWLCCNCNTKNLLTKTSFTVSLYNLVQVINKPARKCGHIIERVLFDLTMTSIKKLLHKNSLQSDHHCTNSYFNILGTTPTTCMTARNMGNSDRPSFTAELSNVSEFSYVE